jgi:hypothetical protein
VARQRRSQMLALLINTRGNTYGMWRHRKEAHVAHYIINTQQEAPNETRDGSRQAS